MKIVIEEWMLIDLNTSDGKNEVFVGIDSG